MATKNKYELKQEKGVLHIGGGRFFYPGESYELTDVEAEVLDEYFNLSNEQTVDPKKTADK